MELYVRMNDEEYEAYHDYKTKCNYEELKQDYDELSYNTESGLRCLKEWGINEY